VQLGEYLIAADLHLVGQRYIIGGLQIDDVGHSPVHEVLFSLIAWGPTPTRFRAFRLR
jgi:hypothetical protein